MVAATAAAVGALVAPGAASAVEATALSCGVNMSYTSWKHIPDTLTWTRTWYWTYYNCNSGSVKRKVIVNNGPDSGCKTIAGKGYAGHTGHESNTAGYHMNAYEKTVTC
jgi:hypothetical protein